MKQLIIRNAILEDLPALTAIYNQAINANQTADSVPMTTADRMSWFTAHQNPSFPLIVAEIADVVCGYATLSSYRGGRPALRTVVEVSYYIHQDHQRKGLGTTLLQKSLVLARELGFKHGVAILLETNLPSIQLLEKFEFEKWGICPMLPNLAVLSVAIYIMAGIFKLFRREIRDHFVERREIR